jgi:plastocyanin
MRFRFVAASIFALLATGCGSSTSNSMSTAPSSPSPTGGSSVTIVSGAQTLTTTAFSPNPLTIAVGTTVTWMNQDNTSHTATANNGAFDTGIVAPGGQASKQFTTAGSFAYHCSLHPNMVATITVQ